MGGDKAHAAFGWQSSVEANRSPLMSVEVSPTAPLADAGAKDSAFGAYAPKGSVARLIRMTRSLPASWLGKRASFALRRLAVPQLKGEPVDIEAMGANFRLFPYNNVCEKRILFTPQYFDQHERDVLRSRLRNAFHFVDIGSNIGGYALFVAGIAGPTARILALEPQPDIFERLTYNISVNPFGTVKAIACAIADKDGELTLFVDAGNRGQSSVKIVPGGRDATSLRVPSRKLATMLREEKFDRVDALKLDVEGAEDLILEPFFKEAARALWPRLLIIERGGSRWSVDVPSLLSNQGYTLTATTKNNLLYEIES